MPHHVETDISVQRFGFTGDETGKKLHFPHAETRKVEGRAGNATYGAADATFENLVGRLDTLRWTAGAASMGSAFLRDDANHYDLSFERIEMPSGIILTRADRGVEILSPHVSLSEVKLDLRGPFHTPRVPPTIPATAAQLSAKLRQRRLRFLDSLSGRIYFTVKVKLDLPVLGTRRLDQAVRMPIQEGSLDYRALDDSLDWLEGAFLDIDMNDDRLAVRWKVPIVGSSKDLISFALDEDAVTLASFGRVPVRSFADFRTGTGKVVSKADERKRKIVQALSLDAIDIALSLLAPRSVEMPGGGLVMFGGDDQPGLVDLKVTGAIKDTGAGAVRGAIGSIDVTIKDAKVGPVTLTADRLHFDGLDQLEVEFDGFTPVSARAVIHRVTATNLRLKLGAGDSPA